MAGAAGAKSAAEASRSGTQVLPTDQRICGRAQKLAETSFGAGVVAPAVDGAASAVTRTAIAMRPLNPRIPGAYRTVCK